MPQILMLTHACIYAHTHTLSGVDAGIGRRGQGSGVGADGEERLGQLLPLLPGAGFWYSQTQNLP